VIVVSGLLFVAAQGGAIFLTAFLLSRFTGMSSFWAKAGWMALSYAGWVAFTWLLFGLVLRPDVYLIPAMGSLTALFATVVYLIAWSVISASKVKSHD
jgi:hypothetical protein